MKLTKYKRCRLREGREHLRGDFGLFLLFAVLSFVANKVLTPKPKAQKLKPGGLGDFDFPTATEARKVPLLWGTAQIAGPNVIWYGDFMQDAVKDNNQTIAFEYRVGVQFALCRGSSAAKLSGFWIGDERVFTGSVADGGTFTIDDPGLFGGVRLGNGGYKGTFKFHAGSATQTADTYISGFQDEGGDTPGYRNICWVGPDTEPFYVGNSTTIKENKFEVTRIPNGLSLATGEAELNGGKDANAMNVIYEILTDSDWGLGKTIEAADINTTNFSTVAATLALEGNGFSMLLDEPLEAERVIQIIEEQVDGVLNFNQSTSQWEFSLARDDYTVGTLDPIDESNSRLLGFSQLTYEDTVNSFYVEYFSRADNYKTTFALAQNTANFRVQGNTNVTDTVTFPGVKDDSLANKIASRELRERSRPLSKARVSVDRTFWDAQPGDVFRFSNSFRSIVDMPMRVTRIDFGTLEDSKIQLDLVQDVFSTGDPIFADPPASEIEDPVGTLVAFADEDIFEAPRALVRRDPALNGAAVNSVYALARRNSNSAASYQIRLTSSSTMVFEDLESFGSIDSFAKLGELASVLNIKSSYPLATLDINASPDLQATILDAFTSTNASDLGTQLTNLILIDDEFMLVESAISNGAGVRLQNIYRGALDTVQADHAANADVFIISATSGVAFVSLVETYNVEGKLIPENVDGTLAEGSATKHSFTMDKRFRRPYPPSLLTINGVEWDITAVSLEGNGSGPEDYHVEHTISRRDYRIADQGDEISQLGVDAGTLDASFPAAQSTDHNIELFYDPSGDNTLVESVTVSGTSYQLDRLVLLQAIDAVVPTESIRITVEASHTDRTELESRQLLSHFYAITTTLAGQFEFGLLSESIDSATYTVVVGGDYTFTLSSAFTSGDVKVKKNGASATTLILAGNTVGVMSELVVNDTVVIFHESTDSGILKQIDMDAAGGGQNGFAVFQN